MDWDFICVPEWQKKRSGVLFLSQYNREAGEKFIKVASKEIFFSFLCKAGNVCHCYCHIKGFNTKRLLVGPHMTRELLLSAWVAELR